jgi:hypothetical protein
MMQQARVQASDALATDYFGCSVALSSDGNTMAVGAYKDNNSGGTDAGSVYVFTRSGTTWMEQARVQASDALATDYFGYSVALSSDGNTMVVGAFWDDNSGGTDAGSAYVFTRSGATWTQQAQVQALDALASDHFGISVALSSDGNTMAVGANLGDSSGGATNAGSAYVFTRSGTTWTQQAEVQASDAAMDDYFGVSVALSSDGNTMAVGANGDGNSGGIDAGSAYVFTRSGTTWTQQARVQASDAAMNDYFGISVALSSDGNTLAVGAYWDDNAGGTNAGSAYVFTRSGTTWTQQARVQASDAAASDYFGCSVALSSDGNTMAVGSYLDDNAGGTNAGSAYIFTRSGTTWAQQARVQSTHAGGSDYFGFSISLSSDGNTLAVGAYLDDNAGTSDAGSAFIFQSSLQLPSSVLYSSQLRLQASAMMSSDQFGCSIALSSDGNTMVVGSYQDDNSGGTDAGSAYVFTRSGTTWTEQTRVQASDAAASDYFGWSVALSSDGNTMAVGAYGDDNSGGADAGSAYVFVRSGTTWTQQARVQASDAAAIGYFGYSITLSSDGNTMAVGALLDNNSGGSSAGSAYVFTRSGTTWTQQAQVQASDAAASDQLGISAALSSDGNTLAVGAIYDDNSGGSNAGSAYVFTRSGTTWTQQARVQASDAAAIDYFGYSVALSSDGNTMAVGARSDDTSGGADAGSAYVFTRSGTTWTQQAQVQALDAEKTGMFGSSIALSSDGNMLAAGAPQSTMNSVYIFYK